MRMGASPSKSAMALFKLSPKKAEELRKENKKVSSSAQALEQLFPILPASESPGPKKMQAYRFWKVSREYSGLFRVMKKQREIVVCFLDDDSGGNEDIPRKLDIVDACLTFLHAFFPSLSFERADDDASILKGVDKSRVRSCPLEDLQTVKLYNSSDLFSPLQEKFRCGGGCGDDRPLACVAILPNSDIYPDEEGNFALGMSNVDTMTAVCCFGRSRRLPSSAEALLWVLVKVTAHELLHLFGLDHCSVFRCLMNEAGQACEAMTDLPLWLCPYCLCKLHHLLHFSHHARFAGLQEALRSRELFKLHEGFTAALQHYERVLESSVFSHAS